MALKHSYTLLAPIYDKIAGAALDNIRRKSLARITITENQTVLINGIGSGLDIPYLPPAHYVGNDITPAMLNLARIKADENDFAIQLICADSQSLPFDNNHFDVIIMHLILAVVPNSVTALQEASRVLKPGGKIYILDKFIKPGQIALFRRLISTVLRHIATKTDVVFEQVLEQCHELKCLSDKPALARGWFRLLELEKIKQ